MKLVVSSRMMMFFALGVLLAASAANSASSYPPQLEAKASVLMDAASGMILHGKAIHERRPMASTTKIMTALIALESSTPNDWVTVSENAPEVSPSCLALEAGERLRMGDLLTGLLLKSANDAAVAIAEHIDGSVEEFARHMNRRAKELGATNTHFVNPHGLFAPDHYSSAYDLAIITREAMKHPRFRELVSLKRAEVIRPDTTGVDVVENHNKLLWRSDSVDGVKTGWVRQSGHCLVASETRNGWQLIVVLLDSPNVYQETLDLLDYSFITFQQRVFAKAGDAVGQARVRLGQNSSVPAICKESLATVIGPGLPSDGRLMVTINKVKAPLAQGAVLGEAKLIVGGKEIASTPLLAETAVARSRLVEFGEWSVKTLVSLAFAGVGIRTSAKIIKARRRRRRGFPPQSRGDNSSRADNN